MRSASVLTGRRLSRREFLRAVAASGIAAGGVAGVASASIRQGAPRASRAADQLSDGPIADLASALAYDVEAMFRFVADEVAYHPYAGALRGARGTLAARAGNSVDKALLLGELLEASLVTHRYAAGPLDAAAVIGLEEAMRPSSADLEASAIDALAGTIPGQGEQPATLDAEAAALAESGAADADRVAAWATQQLTSTLADIDAALGSAGIVLPVGLALIPLREIDQHLWVQAAQGSDWLDLDPSIAGTPIGQRVATSVEPFETLPDDLFHRVDLSVIGERTGPGGLTTATLLKVSERSDVLAGLPITFMNVDPAGVERLGQVVSPVAGVASYVPTLVIGEEAFAGSPIRFGRPDGQTEDLLGGSEGLLGDAKGDESTAEWLEISILSPDREPITARRAIFDRFGLARRAADDVDPSGLPPVPTVPVAEGSSPRALPALAATWLAVSVGLPDRNAPVSRQAATDVGAFSAVAHAQHLFREIGDLALAVPMGSWSFADAPNVASRTFSPRLPDGGEPEAELVLDIWHRSRGVRPIAGTTLDASSAVAAGVLDHIIERLLTGDAVERASDATSTPASVGAVFDAAREQGIGLRLLGSPDDVGHLGYHPDVSTLLATDLADGWLAVVPERPVPLGDRDRAGWWLVDPGSGRAMDRLDDGRGAQGIEFQATLTPGQLAREAAQQMARDCLKGMALLAATAVATSIATVAVHQTAETRSPWGVALGAAAGAGAGAPLGAPGPMLRCLRAA